MAKKEKKEYIQYNVINNFIRFFFNKFCLCQRLRSTSSLIKPHFHIFTQFHSDTDFWRLKPEAE